MNQLRAALAVIIALTYVLTSAEYVSAQSASQATSQKSTGQFIPGEILIQFKDGSEAEKVQARALVNAVRKRLVKARSRGKGDLELAEIPKSVDVKDVARLLASHPAVAFAEPNWVYTRVAAPNDPYYTDGSLWGMYGDATSPTNQYGSQAGEAWSADYTGSNSVYVGVIDEGIDVTHEDLAANIWTNPADPVDGIDNDGNGYVDDVNGWDFYYEDRTVYDLGQDDHGTHVAGTIGARGGNGSGVAGVSWNVKLISAKFLGPTGGSTADAVKAVDYFTDLKQNRGINVVATNNSWGGGGYSQALSDAIQRANDAGILFIAAAGNGDANDNPINTDSIPHYPCSYPHASVICVTAIDRFGAPASWANYGATSVDIGAPGVGVYSTLPGNSYGSYSGTSMATPHVTGAVALYKSIYPGATAAEVKAAILGNALPTASLSGKTVTGGRLSVVYGPPPDPPAAPSSLTATAISSNRIDLAWADNSNNESGFKIERSTSETTGFTVVASGVTGTSYSDTGLAALTTYYYRVRAHNAGGDSDSTTTTSATTLLGPSAAPTSLVATVLSSSGIRLTWFDTSDNEAGFKIERCAGSSCTNFTEVAEVDLNVAIYNDSGLQPSTTYRYRVRSFNGGSESAYSNVVSATTRAAPPSEPINVVATAVSGNQINLSWTDDSNNESGFKIERSTNGTTFSQIGKVGANVTTYSSKKLSMGTTYYYRVRAYNSLGDSDYSEVAAATTLSPPQAPTGLNTTAVSSTSIELSWTDVSDDETGFRIERSTNGKKYSQIATVPANTTSYTSQGLSAGKAYYYRVRAYNSVGTSGNSNTSSTQTLTVSTQASSDGR